MAASWRTSSDRIAANFRGPSNVEVRHFSRVSIDISGTAAMARLEAENWRGTRYTDFFVLVRRDDVWKIASKVFFAHSKA